MTNMIPSAEELADIRAAFNLTDYLTPNRHYDHVDLKQVYYNACDGYVGTEFRQRVIYFISVGAITATPAKTRDGEDCDFLTAVIASHGVNHWGFKVVPGELVLEYYDDLIEIESAEAVVIHV